MSRIEHPDYDPADFQLDHAEALRILIERDGFTVEPVRPDTASGRPAFAYTVGLEETSNRPELAVVGLSGDAASGVLGDFADHVMGGGEMPTEALFQGILPGGLACALLPVDLDRWGEWFAGLSDYYQHLPYRVLQLVYPDPAGRFPWDDDVNPDLRAAQWLIGTWA
jgi:Domain of unknown function (DUF4262)